MQVKGVVTSFGYGFIALAGTAGANVASAAPLILGRCPGSVAAADGCSPSWLPTFGGQPGTDGTVEAMTLFDDGGGQALYLGGSFGSVGGVLASRIGRWDGESWSSLGSGIGGPEAVVYSLTVFDDGSGSALYAGGSFETAGGIGASGVAKWDGATWSALGSGITETVLALAVFDNGSGPALYVGGRFSSAGGVTANSVARWDGASWSAVGALTGTMTGEEARSLVVFDDGSGQSLFAGGYIRYSNEAPADLARWDGSSWSDIHSPSGTIEALTVFDDGTGAALYVGGSFSGGTGVHNIVKWDGSTWSPLGNGTTQTVYAMAGFDDGSGPALYAGGRFLTASGTPASRIAKWDGSSWTALGSGIGGVLDYFVNALAVYDQGSGPSLHVGGDFTTAGGLAANYIATWDGASWGTLGSGLSASVEALAVYDDGGGPALFAGGEFTSAGGMAINRIAKWDGSSWTALGSGMNGTVLALAVHDDGTGPALFAGGAFTTAGGAPALRIAKWDGGSWTEVGGGMNGFIPAVHALVVFDDGSGPALYAGGGFTTAGGVTVNRIARWDGSSWSALGGGVGSPPSTPIVHALAVFDDGGGLALYAGGLFTTAGGVTVNRIGRWNGSSWSALGTGVSGTVRALTVFDDGGGAALYAGGAFSTASGLMVNRIAKWNGSIWAGLAGTGMNDDVFALTVFDDGSGRALYAGGAFTSAAGVAANRIAKWDASGWSAVGSGMGPDSTSVVALTVFDESGDQQTLYAGGSFGSASDSSDSFLARLAGCPDSRPPDLECPSSVFVKDPIGSPSGEVVTFTVTATDNFDPSPTVTCVPSSGSVFERGTTIVHCTATDALGNVSTCEFPVEVYFKARRR